MIFYHLLSLFHITSILSLVSRNRGVVLFFSCVTIIFFILLSGFRYYADADYGAYVIIYDQVPKLDDFTMSNVADIHSEIGFKFFISIFKSFDVSYELFFLVVATLSVLIKVFYFKRFYSLSSSAFSMCLLWYLTFNYFSFDFIQIRMGLAIGVIGFSTLFYLRGENLKSLFMILLASLIHSVSIISLFVFLSKKSRLSWLYAITSALYLLSFISNFQNLLLTLITPLSYINADIIPLFERTIQNTMFGQPVSPLQISPVKHMAIISACYILNKKLDENTILVFKIYCTGFIVSLFCINTEIFYSRISSIFDITEPVLIAMIIRDIFGIRNEKVVHCILIAMLFVFFNYYIVQSNSIYHYKSWLS
ncbi:EpsG family protein [Aeromonas sp. QDB63]|uniref:EpsG family protein n=1 Tax=Aeromonas sp. QDB63 TaxID=2989825 RepID=UPI0022E03B94|nr:EpsG family protein [Aeromonas sp. QDB63]